MNRLWRVLLIVLGLTISAAPRADERPETFIKQSLTALEQQQAAHDASWGLGKADRWFIDQDIQEISFHFPDGKVARAPLQVIGTYNPKDGTFLWAWDHPFILEPLRAHSKLARAWGKKHGLAKWTSRKVQCTEAEAWEFTAVAARLGGANGAYRAPSGGPFVFVTFGEIKLERATP